MATRSFPISTTARRRYPHWMQPAGVYGNRFKVAHAFVPAEDAGVISLCERVQLGLHQDYGRGTRDEQPDLEDTTGCCRRCVRVATRLGCVTFHGRRVPARPTRTRSRTA